MKTVIEMAREAGLTSVDKKSQYLRDCLERLVEIARADEREACAKVCESEWSNVAERIYGEECAAAIRARSNT